MKRKFFATAICLTLCMVTSIGCGKSEDVAAANDYVEPTGPAVTADEPTGAAEVETAAASTDNDTSQGLADVTGENDDFGRVPEEDQIPWDEADEEEVVEETGSTEGIIVMQVDYSSNMYAPTFEVSAIDPQTGDCHSVSLFVFRRADMEPDILIEPAHDMSRYGNYRDMFNDDFTLMAATKNFLGNSETHAGWVNQSGEFFDVTIALNEQAQSDFDPVKKYRTVGFTPDGNFIYADAEDKMRPTYYMVPLDNLVPGASTEVDYTDRHIMSHHYGESTWAWMDNCSQTCKVNDDQFLATKFSNQILSCQLITISSQSMTAIVPTGSQNSWSPVLGPDGNSVAFLSAPAQGIDNPSLYLTDVSGNGTPTKLETSWSPYSSQGMGVLPRICVPYDYSSVLEWR